MGISVTGNNTVTANGVLWYNTPITVAQVATATVTVQNEHWGDPAFAADGYHLTANSTAIDKGVDTGVTTDIDGQTRPYGAAPDLGADEYVIEPLSSVTITGPTTGTVNTAYTFTATVSPVSATTPITYIWQATGQSPVTHTGGGLNDTATFTWPSGADGTQAITVTATNGAGQVNGYYTITISTPPLVAGFTAAPTSGVRPLTVTFTNTSTGDYISFWNFGDGATSTEQHPTHVYTVTGVYTVALTVNRRVGTPILPGDIATLIRTNYITVYEPVHADFAAAPTSGVRPLTVVFTNTSTGDYTTSLWSFGDDITSTQQHPTHTYTTAGTYAVTLTVSGPGGSDDEIKANYITVYEPVHADFAASPTSGVRPLTVVFTDTSSGAVSNWLWGFGDSITSTQQHPTHTYTVAGAYTVTLTVSGPGGCDDEVKTSYIAVYEPVYAGFTAAPTSGIRPLTVAFTDTSTGAVSSWAWTFGDGGSSTQQNPIHIYTTAGVYTVSLTVSGPGGTDTLPRTSLITVIEGAQTPIDPVSGGTLVYTNPQGTLTTVITVPANAISQTITLVYVPVETATAPLGLVFAGRAFELDAYQGDTLLPGFVFSTAITVAIYYSEADVAGLDENSLRLYYLDGDTWRDAACGAYDRHPDQNWLSVPICHLSQFALFGSSSYKVYLPVVMR